MNFALTYASDGQYPYFIRFQFVTDEDMDVVTIRHEIVQLGIT